MSARKHETCLFLTKNEASFLLSTSTQDPSDLIHPPLSATRNRAISGNNALFLTLDSFINENLMYHIEHYLTDLGDEPYLDWLLQLRDSQAKSMLIRRVARMAQGNFGDHKYCRDGVWELRISIGPGYRIYYAHAGQRIVLLLAGGDKRTQDQDIKYAVAYWKDWQARGKDDETQQKH